jgi:hypothetical protein
MTTEKIVEATLHELKLASNGAPWIIKSISSPESGVRYVTVASYAEPSSNLEIFEFLAEVEENLESAGIRVMLIPHEGQSFVYAIDGIPIEVKEKSAELITARPKSRSPRYSVGVSDKGDVIFATSWFRGGQEAAPFDKEWIDRLVKAAKTHLSKRQSKPIRMNFKKATKTAKTAKTKVDASKKAIVFPAKKSVTGHIITGTKSKRIGKPQN